MAEVTTAAGGDALPGARTGLPARISLIGADSLIGEDSLIPELP
jgi:hypothetical protein